jgi:outer membrane protein TolC
MRIRLSVLLIVSIIFFLTGTSFGQKPAARIGIIQDGPWMRFTEAVDFMKQEIISLNEAEYDISFPQQHFVHGNWKIEDIDTAMDKLLAAPDVDMIITLGYVGSHRAAQRKNLKKPVIAPMLIDAKLQGAPIKDGHSTVKNLSSIDRLKRVENELRSFKSIVDLKHMTLLADRFVVEAIPELLTGAHQVADDNKVELHVIMVDDSITKILPKIPEQTDGVLVAPLLRIGQNDFQTLIDGLIQKELPSYSYLGMDEVEQGILATYSPKATLLHLSRSIALLIHDIMRGEKPESLHSSFIVDRKPSINMQTARGVRVYPNWFVMTEADLLFEERTDIPRILSLEQAAREAIAANLDLAVAEREVAAGAEQVLEARSVLLPQVGLGAAGTVIDEERAQAAGGLTPERALTGTASVSQLIYSDEALANYSVQQFSQLSREERRNTVRLDITAEAAIAYLYYLRAKTFENIQKNNLQLTWANLERARLRVNIGVAGPEELYRWESQIANSRQSVLRSESDTFDAINELNRILHRPLRELFIAQELTYKDPLQMVPAQDLFNYLNNQKQINIFGDYMVMDGLETSPELQGIDELINAQERIVLSAERAFWLPDFAVQGEANELLSEDGEGQRDDSPLLDDTTWQVGVFATFPLFQGGGKSATKRRTQEELQSLVLQRSATAERIERRILNAINLIRASYPSISLSRDAAKASNKNLELVTDSYERGVLPIISLLDAQSRALTDDLRATDAVYGFLSDLVLVQRAIGKYVFYEDTEEHELWFNNFKEYYNSIAPKY